MADLRVGTRGSPLALVQAELFRQAYIDANPGSRVELEIIKTTGDRDRDTPLAAFSGQGVFVKEIENALREGRIDVAVHSTKDLASIEPEDLDLTAFLPRADARDVVIWRDKNSSPRLRGEGSGVQKNSSPRLRGEGSGVPENSSPRLRGEVGWGVLRIATGSPRRRAQLANAWPGVEFTEIRGNVDTRLRKLSEGAADGMILAAAGLRRLGLNPSGEEVLGIDVCVPAPGQGAIVVQCRSDFAGRETLVAMSDPATEQAVRAERALAAAVGASCSMALGAYATVEREDIQMTVALHDGDRLARAVVQAETPDDVVERALAELSAVGARWGR